jgi:hypothetical protein
MATAEAAGCGGFGGTIPGAGMAIAEAAGCGGFGGTRPGAGMATAAAASRLPRRTL